MENRNNLSHNKRFTPFTKYKVSRLTTYLNSIHFNGESQAKFVIYSKTNVNKKSALRLVSERKYFDVNKITSSFYDIVTLTYIQD